MIVRKNKIRSQKLKERKMKNAKTFMNKTRNFYFDSNSDDSINGHDDC